MTWTRIRAGVVAAIAAALLAGAVYASFALPNTTPYQVYQVLPVATAVVVPGLLIAAAYVSALRDRARRYMAAVQVGTGLLCLAAVAFLELGGDPNIGGGLAVFAAFSLLILTTAVSCLVVVSAAGDEPDQP